MPNSLFSKRFLTINLPVILALFALVAVGCRAPEVTLSEKDAASLDTWLDENHASPADLVAQTITAGHSVVMAQDDVLRGDTSRLARALLPTLYDAGVATVGVFFMEKSGQGELDEFILSGGTQPAGDKASTLLRSANAALGYTEYCDFIDAVRLFNGKLKDDESPMRIVALGEDGQLATDVAESLVPGMSATEESVGPAFLWILSSQLPSVMDTASGTETEEETPAAPAILRHHGPDPGEGLRWNGLIETVAAGRDLRDRTFAFYGDQAPFSGWDEARIDADIYAVTPYPYSAVTPIPDFITPDYATEARRFFPELSMEKPVTWLASRMNNRIRRAAEQYAKSIED